MTRTGPHTAETTAEPLAPQAAAAQAAVVRAPIAVGGAGAMWDRASDLIVRAGRKSFWPLADQGVVSAGNFLTLVIVARALPARSEYGGFGLALECIFYFTTLQSALVGYPLTVRGATTDDAGLRRLAGAALLMTLIMAVPVALLGAAAAALGGRAALGLAAAGALVAWQ